jgi:hypothetical protein
MATDNQLQRAAKARQEYVKALEPLITPYVDAIRDILDAPDLIDAINEDVLDITDEYVLLTAGGPDVRVWRGPECIAFSWGGEWHIIDGGPVIARFCQALNWLSE